MSYIGIDCGTQSLKAIAWDSETGAVISSSHAYDLIEDLPPGHKEQHPEVWTEALQQCMEMLQAQGIDFGRVRGIGISGQQHGLVVLDSAHAVIRPAKLWCDTSTESQCRQIMEAAGGAHAYMREIGNGLPPGFTASKILWIKQHEPDSYERIRFLLLPHDHLNFHLTGAMTAEAGDASGTGYFKVREREWSDAALSWIDSSRNLRECLPPLIASQMPAGELRRPLAERWGMPRGVQVSSGGGDNMMGAIGSGNVQAGTVTVSLGTSGTLYGYSGAPVVDPDGEIAAFCDGTGGWLPLVCTMNVTVATEMIRSAFFSYSRDAFTQAVESVPPGSDGLLLVPYLEGERTPNVPHGTGVLLGLRPATAAPAHLARAAMEGVTLGLRYGLDRMKELGIDPTEIRLIGGGSKSRVWRQIAADVFGVPVVCPKNQEGPAFGAALQALWCAEGGSIQEVVSRYVELDNATRHDPKPENISLYSEIYELYKSLSEHLIRSDIFQTHRKLIEKKIMG